MTHLRDGYLAMAEWEIAADMLGDINGFSKDISNLCFSPSVRTYAGKGLLQL